MYLHIRERSFLPHACSSLIIDIAGIVRRCYRISVTATSETVNYLLDTNEVYEYRYVLQHCEFSQIRIYNQSGMIDSSYLRRRKHKTLPNAPVLECNKKAT